MAHDDAREFDAAVVRDMRHWIERAVIGLNLCPFAKAVHVHGLIHYVVSHATSAHGLSADLERELLALVAADPLARDTTLLMAPDCLVSFLDFNDFVAQAEQLLGSLGLEGELQIAAFHPQYRFAGTSHDDIGNYTNRAPYPTLHVLRETSVDKAVAAFPEADVIFEHNIETLRHLGRGGWDALGVQRSTPLPVAPMVSGKRRGRYGP